MYIYINVYMYMYISLNPRIFGTVVSQLVYAQWTFCFVISYRMVTFPWRNYLNFLVLIFNIICKHQESFKRKKVYAFMTISWVVIKDYKKLSWRTWGTEYLCFCRYEQLIMFFFNCLMLRPKYHPSLLLLTFKIIEIFKWFQNYEHKFSAL